MSKTDMQLKQEIEAELLWDPKVNAAEIGVTVDKGAITLRGSVDTYAEKWAAEDAARRVWGVRTLMQDLSVKLRPEDQQSDADLEAAAKHALQWDVFVPMSVTATAKNGEVTLEGKVTWNYQREAADRATRYLSGLTKLHDKITLTGQPSAPEVKGRIEAALLRQAHTDANTIKVTLSDGKATLTGTASSRESIDDAANAVWGAPGVTQVVANVSIVGAP